MSLRSYVVLGVTQVADVLGEQIFRISRPLAKLAPAGAVARKDSDDKKL